MSWIQLPAPRGEESAGNGIVLIVLASKSFCPWAASPGTYILLSSRFFTAQLTDRQLLIPECYFGNGIGSFFPTSYGTQYLRFAVMGFVGSILDNFGRNLDKSVVGRLWNRDSKNRKQTSIQLALT